MAGIKYVVVPENTTHKFTLEYLPDEAEFHAEMVVNCETHQRRLKLEHGKDVSGNIH